MILSMTGFSSITTILHPKTSPDKTIGSSDINLTMTLKSLNSRFFELNCRLPFALTQLETDLIKYFKSKLHRGNIYFTLHMSSPSILGVSVQPDLGLVSGYIKAIDQVKKLYNISGLLEVSDLIDLPNAFISKEELANKEIIDQIMQSINTLVDSLIEARLSEGQVLAQDLNSRISTIKNYFNQIEPRAQIVIQERKKQIDQALSNILPEQDKNSLIIYNQLEKIDIHEEIVRFKSLLNNLTNLIESPGQEKGKKIDFTLQELFREINTITAKCSDSQISTLAIDIKFELEKAREQTQNIV